MKKLWKLLFVLPYVVNLSTGNKTTGCGKWDLTDPTHAVCSQPTAVQAPDFYSLTFVAGSDGTQNAVFKCWPSKDVTCDWIKDWATVLNDAAAKRGVK